MKDKDYYIRHGQRLGRKEALNELEKYTQERIDLIVKDFRKNGGDTCSKSRLRELNKVKGKIKSMRQKP